MFAAICIKEMKYNALRSCATYKTSRAATQRFLLGCLRRPVAAHSYAKLTIGNLGLAQAKSVKNSIKSDF